MIRARSSWPLVLVLLLSTSCDKSEPSEEWIEKAQKITDEYQSALKGELMGAMKEGSPAKAIQVCSLEAPAIERRITSQKGTEGWTVSRTAPRVRNPNNRPSDWQAKGLAEIARRIATGESPDKVDWQAREGETFVYMEPIMMGGLCTTCHGPPDSIPAGVKKELARLYPKDEATGFSVGELRGAFVVTGPREQN